MKWTFTTVGTVSQRTRTRDPRDRPDDLFRYVDIASIDRDRKEITQTSELKGADAPSRARKEVKAGDVLVSTVRPNLNAVAVVLPNLDGQIASTGFCVLRPNRKLLAERYLFYFVRSAGFIEALTSKVRGAHYPAVSDGDVKNTKLPLPLLAEQRRIVEILDQADALRKQRTEADTKAARVLPALFYRMFGDPVTNSMGWTIKPLSEHGANVRYGLGQPPAIHDEGVPLIRATNISHGTISNRNMIYVDRSAVPTGRNAFLKSEEVLVVRSGAYTGDTAQVTSQWAGSVAGYDLVVNPGDELMGEFLEAYFLTPYIQEGYFANLKSRAGQPHLNARQLSETPTPEIPKDRLEKFAISVNTIRENRKRIKMRETIVNRLFEVLLHEAFSGDLTAKWREAHMDELLQEIEVQKRALG